MNGRPPWISIAGNTVQIMNLEERPVLQIPFLNAGRRAGGFYEDILPVHVGRVTQLPDDVDAILVTADLQGRERFEEAAGGPPRLLGEVLPARFAERWLPELDMPPPDRIGVVLAGDFYTVPNLDRRGGTGDVTAVWRAFADHFAWVIGVAGNHDTFGPQDDVRPRFGGSMFYLDGDRVRVGGMQFAGVGGIIGNPRRVHRRSEVDYEGVLTSLLQHQTDVLVTHDGPDVPGQNHQGSTLIREVIQRHPPGLVIRGHSHWKHPLAVLPGGVPVLNVDARVVLLRAA